MKWPWGSSLEQCNGIGEYRLNCTELQPGSSSSVLAWAKAVQFELVAVARERGTGTEDRVKS